MQTGIPAWTARARAEHLSPGGPGKYRTHQNPVIGVFDEFDESLVSGPVEPAAGGRCQVGETDRHVCYSVIWISLQKAT